MDHDSISEKVLADIKRGKIASCYLLYGDEEYLISETLKEMIALILPDEGRDLNLVYMDGDREDVDRLREALLTPPLIPGKKIIVLRDTRLLYSRQSLPDLARKIRENLDHDPLRASRDFMSFLRMAGWKLDDFRDENWKTIGEDQWSRITGGDDPGERDKWLPKIVDICVREGLADKALLDGEEEISKILSSEIPEGHCLIITAGAVDKRKRLFKVMAERGVVLNFSRSRVEEKQKSQVLEAAGDVLRKKGKSMDPEAMIALGRKTGFDLRKSMAELEKLIAYTGERRRIGETDVEDIVGKTKEDSIFELTASLTGKNPGKALLTMKDLLDQGVHSLVILAMIIREMRFLLHAKLLMATGRFSLFDPRMDFSRFQKTILPILKEWSSASGNRLELTGQHPYVIYNAFKFSERFSRDELVHHLESLLNVDLALKTTGQDPRIIMERLILCLCSS
jgi:DNA polymerase-3 subunit delta